jgi:hypothetical protein
MFTESAVMAYTPVAEDTEGMAYHAANPTVNASTMKGIINVFMRASFFAGINIIEFLVEGG